MQFNVIFFSLSVLVTLGTLSLAAPTSRTTEGWTVYLGDTCSDSRAKSTESTRSTATSRNKTINGVETQVIQYQTRDGAWACEYKKMMNFIFAYPYWLWYFPIIRLSYAQWRIRSVHYFWVRRCRSEGLRHHQCLPTLGVPKPIIVERPLRIVGDLILLYAQIKMQYIITFVSLWSSITPSSTIDRKNRKDSIVCLNTLRSFLTSKTFWSQSMGAVQILICTILLTNHRKGLCWLAFTLCWLAFTPVSSVEWILKTHLQPDVRLCISTTMLRTSR